MAIRIVLLTALLLGFSGSVRAEPGKTHTVPILVRDGRIFVQATISGKPALLQIDTGAAASTFKLKLVPKHDKIDEIVVRTATTVTPCPQVKTVISIEGLGGTTAINATVKAVFGPFEFGVADGLLGMDVLGSYSSFSFDLKAGRFTVVE